MRAGPWARPTVHVGVAVCHAGRGSVPCCARGGAKVLVASYPGPLSWGRVGFGCGEIVLAGHVGVTKVRLHCVDGRQDRE